MKLFTRNLSRDPSRIREALQRLCEELSGVLGDDLESIVLYGSFARPQILETERDTVNVMLVLGRVDSELLDKMSKSVSRAEKVIPLATMTMTHEDLKSSCDVFPIKFMNMKLQHERLFGQDLLTSLEIPNAHLRLRCEQHLKNLMLRLRAIYLHRNRNAGQLMETLVEANQGFLQDIQACLFLITEIVPEDEADIAAMFGSEFCLPIDVVNEILGIRGQSEVPNLADLKVTFNRFMKLVHDAAIAIDQMEV